ncbi:MAG: P-loop NTPase [FCB group bacterium]|nr:P-loop NTPase [FCB group bacterium]
MNKEDVITLLKTISYPGFSRDIVSFGMVDQLEVAEDRVRIWLKISTPQEEKRKTVVQSVKNALEKTQAFQDIQVLVSDQPPTQAAVVTEAPKEINGNVKHIIAVASGKGGVGKSTLAANLAATLKTRGHAVGLLDLDIYGPSLPIILGFIGQPEVTSSQKIIPMERYGMKVMSFGFLSGNETPVVWRGPLVARMTEQFFRDVEWGDLDYLILDLPPGTGDVQLTLSQKVPLTGAIIVTTPQDIALADVKKGADMFRKVNTPVLGVVENMSGYYVRGQLKKSDGSPVSDLELTIEGSSDVRLDEDGSLSFTVDLFKRGGGTRESERLGVPLLGVLPLAPEIMVATDAGEPLVLRDPESSITKIYNVIADKLEASLS